MKTHHGVDYAIAMSTTFAAVGAWLRRATGIGYHDLPAWENDPARIAVMKEIDQIKEVDRRRTTEIRAHLRTIERMMRHDGNPSDDRMP